jgi:hypothetical protein
MEGGLKTVAKKRSRGLFCSVKKLNGVVTSSCKSFQRFVAACSYTKRLQEEGTAIYTHIHRQRQTDRQCSQQIYITEGKLGQSYVTGCTAFYHSSTRIVGLNPSLSDLCPFVFLRCPEKNYALAGAGSLAKQSYKMPVNYIPKTRRREASKGM